jgi:hypothetical protein
VGGYRYSHANVRGYPGAGMGPGGQCNVMRHDQQRHHPASSFPAMNLQGMSIIIIIITRKKKTYGKERACYSSGIIKMTIISYLCASTR